MVCSVSFGLFAALAACGGGQQAATSGKAPAAGTGTVPGTMVSALAALGPLPATAEVPEPGAKGSKKASLKRDPSFDVCQRSVAGDGKDLARDVERIAAACATVTKYKPVGDLLRGSVDDAGLAKSFSVRFQKGHCYRLYSASSVSVKSLVLSLRDSDGGTIIDTHTDVAPADGSLCFSADDAATLLVASGNGKGEVVVRIYGD